MHEPIEPQAGPGTREREIAADPALLRRLMRRQAALSMRVAAVFLFLILGLPLATRFAPDWTQQPVLGFPLSWFLLGILFYPITWALSAYFVRASERLEAAEAAAIREEPVRP
jgi:uncharacterized membrane protein (DUF485 family)